MRLLAGPLEQAVAERARWPLWLPVLLGSGIGAYFALPFEPPLSWAWSAAAGTALLTWGLRARGREDLAWAAVAVCAMALGFALAGLRTWSVAEPVITGDTGPVSVTGQVLAFEPRPQGARVTLGKLTISRLGPDATPGRVRITLNGAQPEFGPGDWLRLRASLTPPAPPAQPGAFDFQRQSFFEGLGGVGFAFGAAQVVGQAPSTGLEALWFQFQRMRRGISARIQAVLPGDTGAVASALTTGERTAISETVQNDMRASGLAHLLSISGLHVGLVAGIVFFAVRAALALVPPLALGHPIKKWAAFAALLAALYYSLLAGATVPTLRSFLMALMVLAAVMTERQALSMRAVAWAAAVILALMPEALLGASFQMSFAAVVALIAFYESLRRRDGSKDEGWRALRLAGRYIAGVALTTLVAGLATAVYGAYHFNQVAAYSLAANMVAVPLTAAWIMPWAVLAFVLMPFGLEAWALAPMGWGVEGVLLTARAVAAWPGAVSFTPSFPAWGLALVTLGGAWAALWRRHWRAYGALPVALGLASVFFVRSPDVLIDASGELAAVRAPGGGYVVSTNLTKRFERDTWLRRAGFAEPEGVWPRVARPREAWLRCDAQGCLYAPPGEGRPLVAFVMAPEALAEDCVRARVVVDFSGDGRWWIRRPRCPAERVVRKSDLGREGTHAITFTGNGILVETVQGSRGERPWVAP